ncbi:TonB-dependent receptor plug domain-containing protein [Tsuneonella dongtanensis]|nr:TonB-dependent receptor [Tsuneonella dongtanensis]
MSAVLSAPALAQEDTGDTTLLGVEFYPVATIAETEIRVVASGLPASDADDPYPVDVIGDRELRSVQGPDLTRALRRMPGVTITRNGSVGGFTGVRVRGAGAEQLLVLIDGVKVNDVSSPGGGFDFGNLMAEEVGKVELLRGSHSVVWGSDAIAGVMNLSTRTANGVAASAEYGGPRQVSTQALAGVDGRLVEASVSGGWVRSRGISSAAIGTERDGFEQWHVSGRARAFLADGLSAVASGRYADGSLDLDGFPPPTFFVFDDTNERQDTRERSGRAGLEYKGDRLMLSAGVVRSANDRDLVDEDTGPAPYYETTGRLTRAELFGRYRLAGRFENVRIDFGADREWSRFTADGAFSADRGSAHTASGHAMLTYDRNGGVILGVGARYDDHNRFGGEWTLGANGAVELADGLDLRASYGEGFKAPTLFQLLSDFGNPALSPERSKSYDVGLTYSDNAFSAALSLFRRDSRDLIDFVSCFGVTGGICTNRPFGTYDNVGRARAEGFEVELGAEPVRGLGFGAAYSYAKSRDRDAGTDLARRPRHALTLTGDWDTDPLHHRGLKLGADLRLVGDSFDDAGNFTRIDGHALVDLRASKVLFALDMRQQYDVELFGRVENLFDARYTEVAGYGTQGRAAYVGVRVGM